MKSLEEIRRINHKAYRAFTSPGAVPCISPEGCLELQRARAGSANAEANLEAIRRIYAEALKREEEAPALVDWRFVASCMIATTRCEG